MNLKAPPAFASLVLMLWGAALAQTASPPEPGAAATPGESNPERRDTATSTPGTVSRTPANAPARDEKPRGSDADMSAAAAQRPKTGVEAKLSGVAAGTIVQSPTGEPIGRVKDIVPDTATGHPAYVVISTRSGSTAVPYPTIAPLVQDGHVVLDRSRLEAAPHVSANQLQDKSGAMWKKQADRYWVTRNPASLR